ncbi:ABC transporter substrate-binding protein [Actinomadura sp. 7K507]|uniref:ABC transporter substrate-binding protein n=1 Tax=Actinomadura sp. 7K507 TaxID=2530365 RepID=UPI001404A4F8|nr:ABC transporter substrate-binding protein [Actinomadura sp. 7K507]
MRRGFATLAGLALLAAACGGDGGGGTPTIKMGWGVPAEEIKYVMMATPQVAPNLGKCYKVDWQQFAGTAPGVQGLAAGTLDGATVGGLSVANGLDKGADIVITGEFIEERRSHFSTAYMVPESIASPADLRGKTLSTVAAGASTDYIQNHYLKARAGLEPGKDYKKVEVPFGQVVEGIQAGRFVFGTFPQPFYSQLTAAGGYRPLFRVVDVIDPFVQLLQGFRGEYVKDNPEAVKCFMDDFAAVSRYVADPANRDAVVAASSKATKIPADVLEKFLLTKDDFYRPAGGTISVAAVQKQWDFFHEQGAFSKSLKVRDHLVNVSITDGTRG